MSKSLVLLCCVVVAAAVSVPRAQENGSAAAGFTFDGAWPQLPLPNKWTFGGVTGLAVDNDDLVWVLRRPNDLNDTENFAAARLGAYGKPLKDIAPMPRPKYDPKVPLTTYKDFLGHVTIFLAGNDVYVADRQADRIQVFTKQGKFVREFPVTPETLGDGSAVGLALSRDERTLFVGDHMNNVVWLVNRQTDKVVGRIGYLGRNGGGFNALHMVATDSRGNLYTGEVDPNNRVQRFLAAR